MKIGGFGKFLLFKRVFLKWKTDIMVPFIDKDKILHKMHVHRVKFRDFVHKGCRKFMRQYDDVFNLYV